MAKRKTYSLVMFPRPKGKFDRDRALAWMCDDLEGYLLIAQHGCGGHKRHPKLDVSMAYYYLLDDVRTMVKACAEVIQGEAAAWFDRYENVCDALAIRELAQVVSNTDTDVAPDADSSEMRCLGKLEAELFNRVGENEDSWRELGMEEIAKKDAEIEALKAKLEAVEQREDDHLTELREFAEAQFEKGVEAMCAAERPA